MTLSLKLFDIAAALFFFCGEHQLKADVSCALAARGKLLLRLEARSMRHAMLSVQDLIDPRTGDHLARFVNCLAGIGSHAPY